ncbi:MULTISPECIES: hybrid sensor histidine kinase/response regulator [Deefgea]|uniref:histidine kinase n=1 Tax=Deefgea chitinilytica TaxID=570276 RepID=A0ABS2CDE7_9NEIS|nr:MULTISPECIES: response regulator [Deefgea]MBM5572159.1 response regulator [Deefgea chitinilytica]MBM9889394.1 response regulator [Deefgea sp. CFH1-16]
MTRLFSLFHTRHFGITLLIAITAGFISMCGQVIWLYSQSQNTAQDQLKDAAEMMRAPATQALFELNPEMARSVVSSLAGVGRMQEASIVDQQGKVFSGDKTKQPHFQSSLFPKLVQIEIPLKNQNDLLGFLRVTPNRQAVINQFWQAAGELAAIEFLRSFLVAFALALLFQFRIERPFQKLSREILASDPSHPDHTLKLLKQSQISEQVGELGSSIEQFLVIAQQQLIEKNQALGRVEELERLQQVIKDSEASLQLRNDLLEQLSKQLSFNEFMVWLCATLQEYIPTLSVAILIPHNEPPILGAQPIVSSQLWQDYLEAFEFGAARWPNRSMSLLETLNDAESFTSAGIINLNLIQLEPIHPQPRAVLGMVIDPQSPPNAHELATVEVFIHIARLALERQAGNEQLQKTTSEAIAASRAKSDFLANMSHEIRTPLNAVLGFSGLMQQTVLNNEQKEFIEAIHTSGNALLSLINDLLDYSKIEAGHLELEKIEFDLRRLVDDVLDIVAEKVEQKGLMLYTQIDTAFPEKVIGDPGRFRQILLNLINNATKFTASGHIILRLALLQQQGEALNLRCEVIDTGIGIDVASASKLFQPFIQADSSTTRQFGGTGLGLSICRRLVNAMEGEIGVESQVGHGAYFWFSATLYCDKPQAMQLPEQIARAAILAITDRSLAASTLRLSFDENLQCIDLETSQIKLPEAIPNLCILDILDKERATLIDAQIKQRYPDCPTIHLVALQELKIMRDQLKNRETEILLPRPLRRKLLINATQQLIAPDCLTPVDRRSSPRITPHLPILLVEDNPINQRVATLILQKLGCIVTIANNGLECLSILEQQEFALILMDCQMPVMDGFTATRAIRAQQSERAAIPIVALTSNAFQEDRDACLNAGMNDFVTKPVTAQALNNVMNRWAKPLR